MDDEELREAFRSVAGPERDTAGAVLESVRPRMRRRRTVRRAQLAGATLSTALLIGIGVTAIQDEPDAELSVATSPQGEEPAEAPIGDPQWAPTSDAASPPVPSEAMESTPTPEGAVPAEPSATPMPEQPTPAASISPTATAEPPASPRPSSTPEPGAAEEPAPTATLLPEPSPQRSSTPTSTPTSAEGLVEVIESAGGDVTVRYTTAVILVVEPEPAEGYTSEIEKEDLTEVKVNFEGPSGDVEIEIHLEDGGITWDISLEGGDDS